MLATGVNATAFDSESPWALGELNGLRPQLANIGISLGLFYLNETASNIYGGYEDRKKTVSSDQTTLALDYNLSKQWNINGVWSLAITNRNNHTLLTTDRLNDPRGPATNLSQEVWGGGSFTRITHLTYQQNFADDALSIRIGRMSPTEEFFPNGPHVCDFQALLACGTVPGLNNIWYGWPVASWGAAATWHINPEWYIKAGIYQQNPKDLEKSRAWSFSSSGGKGETFPVLLGWTPKWGDKQYQGNYFLAAFYSNVNTPDVYESETGGAQASSTDGKFKERNNRKAIWGYFSQQLTGPGGNSQQGLNAFINAEINDRETSNIHYAYGGGAFYTGLFDSRPQDFLALAFTAAKINTRWAKNLRLNNEINGLNASDAGFFPSVSQEQTTELFYRVQATPWLYVQPGLQFYHNPGAVNSVKDAWVAGFRTGVSF